MNYTYILTCGDGTFYCGWTNDLDKRLKAHNAGKGAKYTRVRRPVVLSYYEEFETKEEAMSREYAIKQLPRKKKEELLKKATLCDKLIHHNVMAETAAHDEEVEDLVGSEVLMPGVEDRQLQGIDHAAQGIDDAAGQKPQETGSGQGAEDLGKCQDAYPAHGNIDQG